VFPWLPGWFLRGLEGKVTGERQRVEVILITHICGVGRSEEQADGLENTLSRLRDSSLEGAVGRVPDGAVVEVFRVLLAGCPVGVAWASRKWHRALA